MDYTNSLLPLLQLQRGQKYNYPTAAEYPATLEDPFDRARGLVNRVVVRPAIGAVSGISGIEAAGRGRAELYEGMGQALYDILKGGVPNATQDRKK